VTIFARLFLAIFRRRSNDANPWAIASTRWFDRKAEAQAEVLTRRGGDEIDLGSPTAAIELMTIDAGRRGRTAALLLPLQQLLYSIAAPPLVADRDRAAVQEAAALAASQAGAGAEVPD
jgi:hypothetical protein